MNRLRCRQGLAEGQDRHVVGEQTLVDLRPQVGADHLGHRDRAVYVERAGALLHQRRAGDRDGAVLQHGLDERRRQPRVGLQHQRHGAGHRGRGHRGARKLHHLFVEHLRHAERRHQVGGVVGAEEVPTAAVDRRGRDDAVAWRHQVGLEQVVALRAAGNDEGAAGRAARAEIGDDVVGAGFGGLEVDGADGDGRGLVPGRADAAEGLAILRVAAVVAGRHHHRDARGHRCAHRRAQRVDAPGIGGIGSDAEVDDLDAQSAGVVHHQLDAFDRIGHRAGAVVGNDLHVEQVGVRRDAVDVGRAGRNLLREAGRHRGHVRAVAVAVDHGGGVGHRAVPGVPGRGVRLGHRRAAARRPRRAGGERLHAPDDAVAGAAVGKGVVLEVDAGIEDGDTDAAAVQARVAGLAADRSAMATERARHFLQHAGRRPRDTVRRHVRHISPCRQVAHAAGRHRHGQAIDQAVAHLDHATHALDPAAQLGQLGVIAFAGHDDLHHAPAVGGFAHPAFLADHHRRVDAVGEVARHLGVGRAVPGRCGVGRAGVADGAEHGRQRGRRRRGGGRKPAAPVVVLHRLDQHREARVLGLVRFHLFPSACRTTPVTK